MRKMFNFHYNNVQCRKIIFAECHNAECIHDLQEKEGMGEAKQRIVLLEREREREDLFRPALST